MNNKTPFGDSSPWAELERISDNYKPPAERGELNMLDRDTLAKAVLFLTSEAVDDYVKNIASEEFKIDYCNMLVEIAIQQNAYLDKYQEA